MSLLRRKKNTPDHQDGGAGGDQPDYSELMARVDRLEASIRLTGSADDYRRVMELRHRAGIALVDSASGADFVEPDFDALPAFDGGLPEVTGGGLTAGLLRAGMLRDGAIIVRGLVPRDVATQMAVRIDETFADREDFLVGAQRSHPTYDEFKPDPRYPELVIRHWIREGGGVLVADCPEVAFEMNEIFAAAGIQRLAAEYLGEPPVVSADKTTLRRVDPAMPGGWHQDGNFMGPVRALNLWLSFSRCGDLAPGLDLVPRRLDGLVVSGTEGAPLDWAVSESCALEAAGDRAVVRPVFEPGDAVFFDELNLHKTASDPSMPNRRFAVENWFFGSSGFPEEYVPIAV